MSKFCTVITDASWCPHTLAAGYAVWVVCDGDRRTSSGGFTALTSNEAEIYALIKGVEEARRWFSPQDILVQSDCVGALARFGLKHHSGKSRYAHISTLPAGTHFIGHDFRVMCKHVKGHTQNGDARSYVNRWCDKNARRHMQEGRAASALEEEDIPLIEDDS